jgi:hypothetical protein
VSGTVSSSIRRRLGALAILLALVGVGVAPATAATIAAASPAAATSAGGPGSTDIATVAAALATDPLYVSTAPGTPDVAAGDVRGALPPDVYVAVLPRSAADQVGGELPALPGAILGRLSRPGTVLVLAGNELDGASRTQPFDRLQADLADARTRLAAGPPAPALVLAARGLTGSGQLSDPPGAARAGSPSGGGFLWVVLGLVVAAILAVPILLRRARRTPPTPPPRVLRDRVEVDAYGRVVRRMTAQEIADQQERGPGGSS